MDERSSPQRGGCPTPPSLRHGSSVDGTRSTHLASALGDLYDEAPRARLTSVPASGNATAGSASCTAITWDSPAGPVESINLVQSTNGVRQAGVTCPRGHRHSESACPRARREPRCPTRPPRTADPSHRHATEPRPAHFETGITPTSAGVCGRPPTPRVRTGPPVHDDADRQRSTATPRHPGAGRIRRANGYGHLDDQYCGRDGPNPSHRGRSAAHALPGVVDTTGQGRPAIVLDGTDDSFQPRPRSTGPPRNDRPPWSRVIGGGRPCSPRAATPREQLPPVRRRHVRGSRASVVEEHGGTTTTSAPQARHPSPSARRTVSVRDNGDLVEMDRALGTDRRPLTRTR